MVMWPTEFPGRTKDCRLVFNVSYAPEVKEFTTYPTDASGVFYLTMPKDWVKPGEPVTLKVCAKDRGLNEMVCGSLLGGYSTVAANAAL